jgi:hypothetical protein
VYVTLKDGYKKLKNATSIQRVVRVQQRFGGGGGFAGLSFVHGHDFE